MAQQPPFTLGTTLLDLYNKSSCNVIASFGSSNTNAQILMYDGNNVNTNGYIVETSNGSFSINKWSNYSSTKLGLGTSNPQFMLDVQGFANTATLISGSIGIGTTLPQSSLHINTTDAVYLPSGSSGQRPSNAILGAVRYNTTNNNFEGYGAGSAWQSLGGVVSIDQKTYVSASNDGYIRFYNSNSQNMALTNNGSVGIGSTLPQYTLDVVGSARISGLVNLSGSVGIGTTNPIAPLSVIGGATFDTISCSNLNVYTTVNGILPGSCLTLSWSGLSSILGNDPTAFNRIAYTFTLNPGYYLFTAIIPFTNLSSLVLTPSTAWATLGLYATTVAAFTTASQPVQFINFSVDSSMDTMSKEFTFFVNVTSVNTPQTYVVALGGYGYNLQISTSLAVATVISVRGLGTNESYAVRTALQIAPVRYTKTVTQSTNNFSVVTPGQFNALSSNVDLYINGYKLGYSNNTINDYTLSSAYSPYPTNQTTFTVTMNSQINPNDNIDCVIWPFVPTSNAFSSGYYYQNIQQTPFGLSPDNSMMYNTIASNVGIGTSSPVNTLSVNGSVAIGTYAATGLPSIANGLIISGSVGIGTTIPTTSVSLPKPQLSVTGGAYVDTLTCSNLVLIASTNASLPGTVYQQSLYGPAGDGTKTIVSNDVTTSNTSVFTVTLNAGYFIATGTIQYTNCYSMVSIPSSAWATLGIYPVTPANLTSNTVPTNFIDFAIDSTTDVMSKNFTFFLNVVTPTVYTVALAGYGYQLKLLASSSFNIVSVSGIGTNDNYTTRTALQTSPVRLLQKCTGATSNFSVTTTGYFYATSSNADVYINGSKLGFSNASIADFSVTSNYVPIANTTTFNLALTNQVYNNDVVECVFWPVIPSNYSYASGYFYQIVNNTTPFTYTASTISSAPTYNIGIGTTNPQYLLDVNGAMRVTGTLYASNMTVLGTTEIVNAYESHSSNVTINNLGTGPALSVTQTGSGSAVAQFMAGQSNALFINGSGSVGIGTTVPTALLTVNGNLNVSGIITGKPAGVRFIAISTGTSIAAGGVLPYNSVLVNIGGGYNATNYTFTAPITGVYTLYASFNNPSWVAWYINGTAWAGLYQYTVSNMQISLSLSVGTTVCMYTGSATSLSYQHSFSGYLEPYTS